MTNKNLSNQISTLQGIILTTHKQTTDNILSLITQIKSIMTTLERLQKAVEKDTAVDQAALTLIQGIVAQLKGAGGDQAKIEELTSKLESNAQTLADAVAANTPAAPAPPVPTAPTAPTA
jgi:hypothetical protein